jgi:hypothetical protein
MVIGIMVHSEIVLINMTGNLKWLLDILSMKDCFSNKIFPIVSVSGEMV